MGFKLIILLQSLLFFGCDEAYDYLIPAIEYSHLQVDTISVDNPTYSEEIESRIKQVQQNLREPKSEPIAKGLMLKDRMKFHKVPAVSIAVISNYELEWARAYGWADRDERIPASTKTLFQAASISKSLNAVGVLHWVERENLDLEADINNYLSSWQLKYNKKANGKKVSLANLLSHTGGTSVSGFDGYEKGKTIPTTLQILNGKGPANSGKVKIIAEPNVKFEYSGGGTMITQLVLEDNLQRKYSRYMKDEILNALGMSKSYFKNLPKNAKLATAHWSKGSPLNGKYRIYPELAPAGLWTNPSDIAKYIIEIQKSLKGESNKLLSQEMTQKMITPHLEGGLTGLGVFLQTMNGNEYFNHGGSNEGFKCYYYGSTTDGNGIVVMTNSENFDIIPEIVRSVLKVYEW